MISYREPDYIDFEEETAFIRFNNQVNRTTEYNIPDDRDSSFIRIKGSTFENLAYQQNINVLSNLNNQTGVECGNGLDFFSCIFKAYDNRGFVINTRGFPGPIQIEDSAFKQNMAYIPDYFIQENTAFDEFLTPATIKYSDFENQSGQALFKVCNF